jgi:hypothetical protein
VLVVGPSAEQSLTQSHRPPAMRTSGHRSGVAQVVPETMTVLQLVRCGGWPVGRREQTSGSARSINGQPASVGSDKSAVPTVALRLMPRDTARTDVPNSPPRTTQNRRLSTLSGVTAIVHHGLYLTPRLGPGEGPATSPLSPDRASPRSIGTTDKHSTTSALAGVQRDYSCAVRARVSVRPHRQPMCML